MALHLTGFVVRKGIQYHVSAVTQSYVPKYLTHLVILSNSSLYCQVDIDGNHSKRFKTMNLKSWRKHREKLCFLKTSLQFTDIKKWSFEEKESISYWSDMTFKLYLYHTYANEHLDMKEWLAVFFRYTSYGWVVTTNPTGWCKFSALWYI